MIGERPVIVVRDRDGSVNVLENRCAHKGAKFCQKEFGNAKSSSARITSGATG